MEGFRHVKVKPSRALAGNEGCEGHSVHGGVDARQRQRAKMAQCTWRTFSLLSVPEVHGKFGEVRVNSKIGVTKEECRVLFDSHTLCSQLTSEQLLAAKLFLGAPVAPGSGIALRSEMLLSLTVCNRESKKYQLSQM